VSVTLAFIPLAPKAKLSSAAIKNDLATRWPSLPPAELAPAHKDQMALRLGENEAIIAVMRAPIPWSDLEGPCRTSWLWKNAESDLRAHAGHLIVTVLSKAEPIAQATLLTQICASILATCPEAPGVFWTNAALLVPSEVFQDFATEILPGAPPLYIWVDFRVGPAGAGKTSGFTTGMAALGHMEFETESSPEPAGELRERLFSLANYVLENGPVIRDGDTIGEDAHERIRVVYRESAFGHPDKVMRLEYGGGDGAVTLDDLQGKWQMISVGRNGNFAPPDRVLAGEIYLSIRGNKFSVTGAGKLQDQGTVRFDGAQTPAHFDQHSTGPDGMSVRLGIIRLEDDELECCQGEPGSPRPKDFARNRRDGANLARFRRA
jgi:uncharacterized protein (TIGR03067 family)